MLKASKYGSADTSIAVNQANPEEIAVDGCTVYWTTRGVKVSAGDRLGVSVMKARKNEGDPVTVAEESVYRVGGLGIDRWAMYWGSGPHVMMAFK